MAVAFGLLMSCSADRTKVELTNGEGEKVEVKTIGMKKSDFDYETFVKLSKMTSDYARIKCANPRTYVPEYIGLVSENWERNTKDFENEYTPKDKVVTITLGFEASNAFGVKGGESVTCYFEKDGDKYKNVTIDVLKARHGDLYKQLDGV